MRKSLATIRQELKNQLIVTLAKQGVIITPDLEAKIDAKVLTQHPYQADELPGFRTAVVLTRQEVIAAAVALGLIDRTDDTFVMPEDSTYGKRAGDVQTTSQVDGKPRESVIRTTKDTEMEKYGVLYLFRPAHERTDKTTENLINDILEG